MLPTFNEWVWNSLKEDLEPDFLSDQNDSVYTPNQIPTKWKKNEEGRVKRSFAFNNYKDLMEFLDDVNDDFQNRAFYPSITIEDATIKVDIGKSIEITNNAISIAKDMNRKYKAYNMNNIDAGSEMDPSSDFITLGDKKTK